MGIITVLAIFPLFAKNVYFAPQKQPKLIKHSGIILFLIIMIGMVIHCMYVVDLCISSKTNPIYNCIVNFSYVSQCASLLLSWFIRLYYAFNGTPLELSKITIIVYISIFLTSFIFATLLCFANVIIMMNRNLWLLTLLCLLIWFAMLTISLTFLFIQKLIKVYKNLGSDDEFIGLITKITLLNFISVSITIISAITLL